MIFFLIQHSKSHHTASFHEYANHFLMGADLGALHLGIIGLCNAQPERIKARVNGPERKLDILRQKRFLAGRFLYRNDLIGKTDLICVFHPFFRKFQLLIRLCHPDCVCRIHHLRHNPAVDLILLQAFPGGLDIGYRIARPSVQCGMASA